MVSSKSHETESEDELLDEGDDDVEDDHDYQEEVQDQPEPLMSKPVEVPSVPRETERQLSKKERRKKELAELDAILANFGVNTKERAEEESSDANKLMKEGELSGDAVRQRVLPLQSPKLLRRRKRRIRFQKMRKSPKICLNAQKFLIGKRKRKLPKLLNWWKMHLRLM